MDDNDEAGDVLDLRDQVLCFVAVALGMAASVIAAAWLLSYVQAMSVSGMGLSPFWLLGLVGHVVRQRALQDWRRHSSKPVVVRFMRAFFIGFLWPLSMGRWKWL